MADSYYTEEETLVEMPKGRDLIKLMIGRKEVRGEKKEYLDLRVWYTDDAGISRPGKGFAKPLTLEEMKAIGEGILGYVKAH